MADSLLAGAGAMGMLIALVHGTIGHRSLLPALEAPRAATMRVNRAVFQLSTLYWLMGGALLTAAPFLLSPEVRQFAAIAMGVVYLIGGLGNMWATRARHFGGPLLIATAIAAFIGS